MLQPVIQKHGDRLPGWKRNLFSYPGRELLVKYVLSPMPTFFLTVFKMPKWAHTKMDKYRKSFLWKGRGTEHVSGGHCLVNWQCCLRPKKWGGLRIKDLEKSNRALTLSGCGTGGITKTDPGNTCSKSLTEKVDISFFLQHAYILVMEETPLLEI
jgi:hypothetical protein